MGKHSVLIRQLRRASLTETDCPNSLENWQEFLERVNRAYNDLDQERYLSERTQEVSSREMQELYEEIEDKQIHLQAIFDNVKEGIIIADKEGIILSLNMKAALMFGHDVNEIIGKNINSLLNLADDKNIKNVSNYINVPSIEINCKNKQGVIFPAELSLTEIIIAQKSALVGIIRDISERKLSEQKEKELNNELITSARLAGMAEVSTSILHNVGNVLNSVVVTITLLGEKINYARLLKSINKIKQHLENSLNSDLKWSNDRDIFLEYVKLLEQLLLEEKENVNAEMKSLLQNIQHIRDVIAMQQDLAGNVLGVIDRVDLSKLLNATLRIVGFDKSYAITTLYKIKKSVVIDKIKLMQILVNIIRNAKDAMVANNPPQKKIMIRTKIIDQKIIIQICDNGIGISPAELEKLFTFGFTTKPGGHGYGLHNSLILAKQMGGVITVKSRGLGRGALFTVELPYTDHKYTQNHNIDKSGGDSR